MKTEFAINPRLLARHSFFDVDLREKDVAKLRLFPGFPAFSDKHYLKRESWNTQEQFKTHVLASVPEYNHRYAHPVEWTWTNYAMRQWFTKHAAGISCKF